MSSVIQAIEKRMKKFINKAAVTPSQTSIYYSELTKIKLNPIENTPIPNKKSGNAQDFKGVKRDRSLVHLSYDITNVGSSTSIGKIKSRLVVKLDKTRMKSKDRIENFGNIAKKWNYLAAGLRNLSLDAQAIRFLIEWRKRIRALVVRAQTRFLVRRAAAGRIQRFWKMFLDRQKFRKMKKAVKVLQGYWRLFVYNRKNKRASMMIANFLTCSAKLKNLKMDIKEKSAIMIQKHIKRFFAYKKYHNKIASKTKTSMHEKLKKRQRDLLNERRNKKKAVQVIER